MTETAEEEAPPDAENDFPQVPVDVDFDKIATVAVKYPSSKMYGEDVEGYISWYKTTPLSDLVRRFFAHRGKTWKIKVGGKRAKHMMMGSVLKGRVVKLKTKH